MTEEQAQVIIQRLDRIIQLLEQNNPALQVTYTTPDHSYWPPNDPKITELITQQVSRSLDELLR